MNKNQLIDLIGKLTGAALALPQNKKEPDGEAPASGSFLKATEPPKPAPQKTPNAKKQPSDAIIKMINQHNALSREIAMKNGKS